MQGHPIDSYGSPQTDGPARTVLAVLAAAGTDSERAYKLAKPFCEYLSSHALEPSFDLWEFAVGNLFANWNLARRALIRGARLAEVCRDEPAAERFRATAAKLESGLAGLQERTLGFIPRGRDFLQPWMRVVSQLDIGIVDSILTFYDSNDSIVDVDGDLMIQTVERLEAAFEDRWPVNIAWRELGMEGLGMGRFPEDMNDGKGSTGGNPWTFTTPWAAEYYLRLWQRSDLECPQNQAAANHLLAKADGYLQFVLNHGSPASLHEQIDGQSGRPRGARNLAMAHAALINVLALRHEVREGIGSAGFVGRIVLTDAPAK